MNTEKRNLSSACETCKNNEECLLYCVDVCSIPNDLLKEIENSRRTYEEAKITIQTLKEHFVNNLFTN